MQYDCRARLAMIVMVVGLAACEGPSSITSPVNAAPARVVEPTPPAPPAPPVAAAPVRGESLGTFRLTMYYVTVEPDRPDEPADEALADDDVVLASGSPDSLSGPPDNVTIYAKDCTPLAEVSREFARKLDLQGTGKLRDGRVVNTSGLCSCPNSPCFMEINAAWAIGAGGRLAPFRSVAVDTRVVPLGSLLYIPELAGARMPGKAPWGGYVHDGCVIADDRGGGIRGKEIDFFAAKKSYADAIYRRTRLKQVTVHDGTGWCERRPGGRVRKIPGAI